MRELFSFIFDQFTDPLSLPIDPLYEWVILGVIGLIAYFVSFRIVGDMYSTGGLHGSFLGSLVHWAIRLLIFAAIWFVVYWVIVIGQWIIAHWAVLLVGFAICLAVYLLLHYWMDKKLRSSTDRTE